MNGFKRDDLVINIQELLVKIKKIIDLVFLTLSEYVWT